MSEKENQHHLTAGPGTSTSWHFPKSFADAAQPPAGRVGYVIPTASEPDWDTLIRLRPLICEKEPGLKYLLKPEIARILQHLDDTLTYLLAKFLWHTGARINEALNVKKGHVRVFEEEQLAFVLLNNSKRGAGRRRKSHPSTQRVVPICNWDFVQELQRYMRDVSAPVDAPPMKNAQVTVFQTSRSNVDYRLKRARSRAGYPDELAVSAHVFRHSFACNLLLQGRDLRFIQKMLGHRKIESTLIYTNLIDVDWSHLMRDVQF